MVGTRLLSLHFSVSSLKKKLFTLLDLCVSSLRRGHANLLCIVPILSDDLERLRFFPLSFRGCPRISNGFRDCFVLRLSLKKEYIIPGLNWGPLACEASVITTRPMMLGERHQLLFEFDSRLQVAFKTAHRGARTHDHQLKRLALYRLS